MLCPRSRGRDRRRRNRDASRVYCPRQAELDAGLAPDERDEDANSLQGGDAAESVRSPPRHESASYPAQERIDGGTASAAAHRSNRDDTSTAPRAPQHAPDGLKAPKHQNAAEGEPVQPAALETAQTAPPLDRRGESRAGSGHGGRRLPQRGSDVGMREAPRGFHHIVSVSKAASRSLGCSFMEYPELPSRVRMLMSGVTDGVYLEWIDPESDLGWRYGLRVFDRLLYARGRDVINAGLPEVLDIIQESSGQLSLKFGRHAALEQESDNVQDSAADENGYIMSDAERSARASRQNSFVGMPISRGSSRTSLGLGSGMLPRQISTICIARTDHTPGFGIEIDADTKGGLLVRRILRGGAADLDGRLCPNDVLVAVNGIGVSGMDLEDVQEAIRNGPAYVLEVTVARESSSGTPARPAPLAATSAAHSVMSLYSNNSRDLGSLLAHNLSDAGLPSTSLGRDVTVESHQALAADGVPESSTTWAQLDEGMPYMATVVLERAPNETFGLTVSGVADHRKLAIGQHGVIVTGIKGNTPSSEQQLLECGVQIIDVNGCNLINEDHDRAAALLRSAGEKLILVIAKASQDRPPSPLVDKSASRRRSQSPVRRTDFATWRSPSPLRHEQHHAASTPAKRSSSPTPRRRSLSPTEGLSEYHAVHGSLPKLVIPQEATQAATALPFRPHTLQRAQDGTMDGKTESQSSPPTTSSATGSLASPPPRTESDDNPPPLVAHGVTAPDAREDKQTHRNVQPQSAPSTPKRVIPPVHHVERSPVHANGTPPAVLQRSPRARSDFHLRPSPPTRRITSNPVLLSHTSPSTDVASIVAKAWQTTGSPATSSPRLGRPRVAVADKPALPSDYVAESIVAKAWRRDSEASQGSTGPVSVPEHWETFYVSLPFNIHTPKLGITVVAHRSLDGAGDGVAIRALVQGHAAAVDGRLQRGDVLMQINGRDVSRMGFNGVAAALTEADRERQLNRRIAEFKVRRRAVASEESSVDDHASVSSFAEPSQLHSLCDSPVRKISTSHIRLQKEQGKYGVVLQTQESPDLGRRTFLTSTVPGSAASRCRFLQAGQELMAVNGTATRGLSHDEVIDLLRNRDDHVELTLQ